MTQPTPLVAPAGEAALGASRYRLGFQGRGGSFFLIFLKNVLLTLLTLGVYLAWGKTERRKYIWSNLSFHGEPFRYTGTGLELFKGYLVVLAAYLLFLGLPALLRRASPDVAAVVQGGLAIGFVLIAPVLMYRSRAFLYNRTTWRGIRFGLDRSKAGRYARIFLMGLVMQVLTLGLATPVVSNRLHRVVTDNTSFGSLAFRYTGSDREAFRIGIVGIVLTLLTLGLYSFWYAAAMRRFQFENTHIGESATLRSELGGGDLFLLFLLQVFGTTLTLGLAFPWIAMYAIRVMADNTAVEGRIDFEAVEQRQLEKGATSEGFADALDLDLGF